MPKLIVDRRELRQHITDTVEILRKLGIQVEIRKRLDHYIIKIVKHYPFFLEWSKLLDIIDVLESRGFHITHITAGKKGLVLRAEPTFFDSYLEPDLEGG